MQCTSRCWDRRDGVGPRPPPLLCRDSWECQLLLLRVCANHQLLQSSATGGMSTTPMPALVTSWAFSQFWDKDHSKKPPYEVSLRENNREYIWTEMWGWPGQGKEATAHVFNSLAEL